MFWSLSFACLLQTVSNFVVSFDDGFRVSALKNHVEKRRSSAAVVCTPPAASIWSHRYRPFRTFSDAVESNSSLIPT